MDCCRSTLENAVCRTPALVAEGANVSLYHTMSARSRQGGRPSRVLQPGIGNDCDPIKLPGMALAPIRFDEGLPVVEDQCAWLQGQSESAAEWRLH